MRKFKELNENVFYKLPKEFNKYSDREILKYSLGANLYINGLIDVFEKLLKGDLNETTTITVCFEDSIKSSDLDKAQELFINSLEKIKKAIESNEIKYEDLPLIFIRVRNLNQFENFLKRLKRNIAVLITGFIFPKFNLENGRAYLELTKKASLNLDEIFYTMPILESKEIIFKESRIETLLKLDEIIKEYRDIILNLRVGGTDFSSKFALRRKVDKTIYDLRVIGDCLVDIINIFGREEKYVISAAVYEYFSKEVNSKEVKGLLKEIELDRENGFVGKTVIHPYQVKYVDLSYLVSYEEYIDAMNILKNQGEGGVFKGYSNNKMNENLPHSAWARKILNRAEIYGVLNEKLQQSDFY